MSTDADLRELSRFPWAVRDAVTYLRAKQRSGQEVPTVDELLAMLDRATEKAMAARRRLAAQVADENERLANCTHDEVPPLSGGVCGSCGADLNRVGACDHVWPDELGPGAVCVGCHMPYAEFEVAT